MAEFGELRFTVDRIETAGQEVLARLISSSHACGFRCQRLTVAKRVDRASPGRSGHRDTARVDRDSGEEMKITLAQLTHGQTVICKAGNPRLALQLFR
jgi:hypothetical protein